METPEIKEVAEQDKIGVCLWLTVKQRDKLRRLARDNQCSMSELVRRKTLGEREGKNEN